MRGVQSLLIALSLLAGTEVVRADEEPDIDEPDIDEPEPPPEPEPPKAAAPAKTSFNLHEAKSRGTCEKIEESPLEDDETLFHFAQHDDRLDPNKFAKIVFKIIAKKKVEMVKKVVLDYNPQVKSVIGLYPMYTVVTAQSSDGSLVDKCYEIRINVHDTDECTHATYPAWMHKCHPSAECVNTEGSYYCQCRGEDFAFKGSGGGKCTKGEANSKECCGLGDEKDEDCLSDFRCHSDNCATNECSPHATCIPGTKPNEYSCDCHVGFKDKMTGGKAGRTCLATNYCVDKTVCPTSCQCQSVVNKTHDGFYCLPEEGFTTYTPAADEWETKPKVNKLRLDPSQHICVDQAKPPIVAIEGANPMVIPQGDEYDELGATIIDEHLNDLIRRFEIDYNDAPGLVGGMAMECGLNTVAYTINTPWISGRPRLTKTRTVEIVDVNECAYNGSVDKFKAKCIGHATCENLPCDAANPKTQGYRCNCHDPGYEPDGLGGCVDKRPPVIECTQNGCAFIEVYVVKAEGAILEHPFSSEKTGILFYTSDATPNWVSKTLNKIPQPVLRAYDLVPSPGAPDLKVDLTSSITAVGLKEGEDNVWVMTYKVADLDSNTASFPVKYKVTVLDESILVPFVSSLHPMNGTSNNRRIDPNVPDCKPVPFYASAKQGAAGGGAEMSAKGLAFYISCCVVGLYLLLGAALRALCALQVLLAPGSMRSQRARFETGMDTLLVIQSLGTLNPNERAKVADAKWDDLFE